MTILETRELTRRFGEVTAVDGFTVAVEEGEAFGLLGPNGAGKTTVIRMLTTLLPPTSGSARVAGCDVRRQAMGVRRAIGYVPQAISVDGSLTAYENLLIFAKLYDIPRSERADRIAQGLALVGLTDSAGRQVREFSGGMIRRLEIAQSTLHRPRLLFLGKIAALGSPEELKASLGQPGATLNDVFRHYAGDELETGGGGYREASRSRWTARRLG
jgi:ABC-2 type transport system ATP-binding protein